MQRVLLYVRTPTHPCMHPHPCIHPRLHTLTHRHPRTPPHTRHAGRGCCQKLLCSLHQHISQCLCNTCALLPMRVALMVCDRCWGCCEYCPCGVTGVRGWDAWRGVRVDNTMHVKCMCGVYMRYTSMYILRIMIDWCAEIPPTNTPIYTPYTYTYHCMLHHIMSADQWLSLLCMFTQLLECIPRQHTSSTSSSSTSTISSNIAGGFVASSSSRGPTSPLATRCCVLRTPTPTCGVLCRCVCEQCLCVAQRCVCISVCVCVLFLLVFFVNHTRTHRVSSPPTYTTLSMAVYLLITSTPPHTLSTRCSMARTSARAAPSSSRRSIARRLVNVWSLTAAQGSGCEYSLRRVRSLYGSLLVPVGCVGGVCGFVDLHGRVGLDLHGCGFVN